jgi:hypothetical protein
MTSSTSRHGLDKAAAPDFAPGVAVDRGELVGSAVMRPDIVGRMS